MLLLLLFLTRKVSSLCTPEHDLLVLSRNIAHIRANIRDLCSNRVISTSLGAITRDNCARESDIRVNIGTERSLLRDLTSDTNRPRRGLYVVLMRSLVVTRGIGDRTNSDL